MRLLYSRSDTAAVGEIDDAGLVDLYRHPVPPGRAWLRTNFVATLDGSISGPDGRSGSINTVSDHHVFALHRALADVILVGAGTVRAEGYRAVDLAPWQRELRAAQGLRDFPTLAVVTSSLDLDPAIADPPQPHGPVMIVCTETREELLAPFRSAAIEVLQLPGPDLDLTELVRQLAGSGLPRVLCEGGPRLHRDLLAADLVDELSLTLSPTVTGGSGQRSTSGGPLPPYAFRLEHALYAASDDTVFTTYRRAR